MKIELEATKEECSLLKEALVQDLKYYQQGLETALELSNISNDPNKNHDFFVNYLVDHDLDVNLAEENIPAIINNTGILIDLMVRMIKALESI